MVEQKTPGNRYHDAKGRFAPGNPGNPNSKGRPKSELTITDILRAELQKRPKLIQRWLDLCESADENVAGRMLVSLANRLEGLPRQAIDMTHKEDAEQFDAQIAAKLEKHG